MLPACSIAIVGYGVPQRLDGHEDRLKDTKSLFELFVSFAFSWLLCV